MRMECAIWNWCNFSKKKLPVAFWALQYRWNSLLAMRRTQDKETEIEKGKKKSQEFFAQISRILRIKWKRQWISECFLQFKSIFYSLFYVRHAVWRITEKKSKYRQGTSHSATMKRVISLWMGINEVWKISRTKNIQWHQTVKKVSPPLLYQ